MIRFTFFLLLLVCFGCKSEQPEIEYKKIEVNYPETKKDTVVVDNYHGTEISDPFRWLEDDNSDDTKKWVGTQNEVTQDYISQIPYRDNLRNRLEKLWNYEKYSSPFKEGGKYYYFKNDGLQNHNILYGSDDIKSEGEVALDPNKFSDDGTASLGGMAFNKEGNLLAYLVSEGGSDWRTCYVKDMKSGALLVDKIEWIKFSSISWKDDGFYYSRYPEAKEGGELSAANEYHSLFYHKLGTDQKEDKLIYVDRKNPQRNVFAGTTEDERFLIISASESTSGNGVSFINLEKDPERIVNVVKTFDNDFNFVENLGDNLLFLTNYDAPKLKVISINADKYEESDWKEFISESDDPLRNLSIVGDRIFASYMHNASSQIKIFDMNGKYQQDLELPGIGTVGGVQGKKSDEVGFYSYNSFTRPNTIYSLNTKTLKSEVFRSPNVDFDSDAYETKQVWYTSKDGTKIPMFLTMKKGLKLDGKRPTLLYGYGGFNIPITPGFNIARLPILENNGIYAVANIRGGGEFGTDWHKAGTKERKQNVFDDFIAAAEYLIANDYTSSDKLAIEGRSNGGLLVGATMTQRPDLFAVAFPGVGVLDMLRYHEFTIGWAWATDYGRSDDKEAFDYLIKYSPLHNVKPAAYPATMVTTADHDDRVVPAHSFKFISELQAKHNGENPVLIRIDVDAGHGAGKSTSKRIDEAADLISFMFYNMKEPIQYDVKG